MISVIITTYKRADNLSRAINSVLNQTYKDYEIIVVDDNDADTEYRKNTEQIMTGFCSDKIHYLKHERNKNGAAARNTGIKCAKGDYITFLDDDDYFMPDRLEKLVSLIKNKKGFDCIYSSVAISEDKGFVEIRKASRSGNFLYQTLCHDTCWVTGSNILFTRAAIEEIGDFDESFNRHQDTEYMVRFFLKGYRILACEDILVVKNQDDRVNEVDVKRQIEIKRKFLGKFQDVVPQNVKNMWDEINYRNYFIVLWLCVRNHNLSEYKKVRELVTSYRKIPIRMRIKLLFRWIYCFLPLNPFLLKYRRGKTKKNLGDEFKRIDDFILQTERI